MKKILKLSAILFAVCAIVAGILGGVNELTKDRIAEITIQKTKAAYSAVLASEDYETVEFDAADPTFVHVDKISKCTGGEGYVVEITVSGAQGMITMAVGVDNDLKCTGISIIDHSETSGLGANAASTATVGVNFRSQFKGEGKDIAITKAGGNIDALSGATITSKACCTAVAEAITAVEALG